MSHSICTPALARGAAMLVAVPALFLGLQSGLASAAATNVQEAPGICGPHPTYGGFFCDLNDIAGLLSGVLDTTFQVTCLNQETNFIICRTNTDNTPYGDGS